MSKLKIEKGASKVRREPLKVTIDGSISDDLKLMCDWSENDLSYVVNLLLDFAITQSEDFQKYKTGRGATPVTARNEPRLGPDPVRRPAPVQPDKGASA